MFNMIACYAIMRQHVKALCSFQNVLRAYYLMLEQQGHPGQSE